MQINVQYSFSLFAQNSGCPGEICQSSQSEPVDQFDVHCILQSQDNEAQMQQEVWCRSTWSTRMNTSKEWDGSKWTHSGHRLWSHSSFDKPTRFLQRKWNVASETSCMRSTLVTRRTRFMQNPFQHSPSRAATNGLRPMIYLHIYFNHSTDLLQIRKCAMLSRRFTHMWCVWILNRFVIKVK